MFILYQIVVIEYTCSGWWLDPMGAGVGVVTRVTGFT